MTLTEVAKKYNSDKLHSHSYIPFYENLFAKKQIRQLLEIGIGHFSLMAPFVDEYCHGSSLLMWREFLPHAEIYACDIKEDTLIQSDRIHTCACDQSSIESINNMIGLWPEAFRKGFDLIIDDGSHEPDHQIFTFKELNGFVRDKGLYVIEDVRSPELVAEGCGKGARIIRFDKRPDDCLVVVQL